MSIVLYRILGNDLPPRHDARQTLKNLHFMLENEPDHPEVEKRFLLNRIVDTSKLVEIRKLLDAFKYEYSMLMFIRDDFRELSDESSRAMYVTNLNQARNECVRIAMQCESADAVLPFDGACCFRGDGLEQLVEFVANANADDVGYGAVPMWRVPSYEDYLDSTQPPQLKEEYLGRPDSQGRRGMMLGMREPQIVFCRAYDQTFNEQLTYGRVPKVELLWRIGIPGIWDRWEPAIRNATVRQDRVSKSFGNVPWVSYCCRLPSGNRVAEVDAWARAQSRVDGVRRLLELVDKSVAV